MGQLQAQAGATLQEVRSALAARGHGEAALRRVKLADYRGEQLLEVGLGGGAGGLRWR